MKKRFPFCEGSKHVFANRRSKVFGYRQWQVVCDGCGAQGPIDTSKQRAREIFYTMQRAGGYQEKRNEEYIEPDYDFD